MQFENENDAISSATDMNRSRFHTPLGFYNRTYTDRDNKQISLTSLSLSLPRANDKHTQMTTSGNERRKSRFKGG